MSGLAAQAATGEEALNVEPPQHNAVVVRARVRGFIHRCLVLGYTPKYFDPGIFDMAVFAMGGGGDHYVARTFGVSAFSG